MAASIGGYTIHHWSGIPTAQTEGRAGTKDTSALSIKCQCLRFILIDEISMVSAELLSVLERVVQIGVKNRTLWKKRADGSKRAFGGINVLLFGDWWQLKPVAGTPLFQSPFGPAGNVQKSVGMFWGEGRDAIHHTWELKDMVRCKDRWYNLFLMGCRDGNLSCGLYNFVHGFPTLTPGSFIYGGEPATSCLSDKCCKHLEEDPLLGWYRRDWKTKFLQGYSGVELMRLAGDDGDCEQCKRARVARTRVLPLGTTHRSEFSEEPFASAPAIYNFNVPRYYTILLRAREFAKQAKQQLTWCLARDVPLFTEDRELPADELNKKRMKWLERHDQDTAHLSSVLPLVKGLPIRLTESIDRGRKLYRGRRGFIYAWVPHAEEKPMEIDGEVLMRELPRTIYVRFPNAAWSRISDDFPEDVYPVTPVSRTWKVNKYTGISARRSGYFMVPDFGSTAHMIQGQTLEAAFADAQEVQTTPSSESHIVSYIGLSRVKEMQNIWMLQPFSPFLFRQGAPKGPAILMQRLRGEITA